MRVTRRKLETFALSLFLFLLLSHSVSHTHTRSMCKRAALILTCNANVGAAALGGAS